MLDSFERQYMQLRRRLQKEQWQNYFQGGQNDLTIMDGEIYALAEHFEGKIKGQGRKAEIARLWLTRELVDKAPAISALRNRLDDFSNYDADFPVHIKENRLFYRRALAQKMRADVLDLMTLRDSLACAKGYNSYVDLVLATEGLKRERLLTLINSYLNENLPLARQLINKYEITFENWFADLDRIGGATYSRDQESLSAELLAKLGFGEVLTKLRLEIRPSGFSGYCAELSAQDIRVAIRPVDTLDNLRLLFHELGHAVAYSSNDEEGLLRILPAGQDEAMAVAFEFIASTVLLEAEARDRLHDLMILEYTRCAVSALFEFDLWKNPAEAEELYQRHYEKMGYKISDYNLWAVDSFRSIDPVCIHNYVIGASIAEKMVDYLQRLYKSDYLLWGKWLRKNIYSIGNKKTLANKVAALGVCI